MSLAGNKLSIAQAAQLANEAGFTGRNLVIMIATSIGESGLYTEAINANDPGGGSFGIVQINGVHFGKKFGPQNQYIMSQAVAFNPQLAYIFAYELSGGFNFRPWGAYTNGSYAAHLSEVEAVIGPNGEKVGSGNTLYNTYIAPVTDPITADSSWSDFCKALDEQCALSNPFEGDLNFNPVDGSPAFGEIGAAMWSNTTALAVRTFLILLGVVMAGWIIISVIPLHQIVEDASQDTKQAALTLV